MQAPCIFPTLRYRDANAAITWLCNAFGFREHAVHRNGDGKVAHAQLAFGSSIIMLGQAGDDAYQGLVGDMKSRRTDAIYVAVEDIDPVYASAQAAAAKIEMAPHDTDYDSREFTCRDLERNLWSFGTYWPKADA